MDLRRRIGAPSRQLLGRGQGNVHEKPRAGNYMKCWSRFLPEGADSGERAHVSLHQAGRNIPRPPGAPFIDANTSIPS
jgi:hypothetical protein